MNYKLQDVRNYAPATANGIVVAAIVLLTEFALLSDNYFASVDCVSSPLAPSSSGAKSGAKATNPLIYKRLRFDLHSMQILRRYQKLSSADEHKESIKVDRKLWNAATNKFDSNRIEFDYYQNDAVDMANLTYDDLIFEALDRAYLSRLIPPYIYNYDDKEELRKSSDPRLVSRSKCDHELSYLMRQLSEIERARETPSKRGLRLSNEINPELLGFFDAFARDEDGLLLGNHHWTRASWRECSARQVFNVDKTNLSNSVDFTGRYCLAVLRSDAWDAKVEERARELKQMDYFRYPSQEYNYKRFHRVQAGICLPQSCDSQIIASRPDDIRRLATHKLSYPVRAYKLVDLYCLPDETSELRQLEPGGRLFVLVSLVWLSLVALATYLDHRHSTKAGAAADSQPKPTTGERPQLTAGQKFVMAFSFARNFDRLFETKSCQPLPPLSARFGHLQNANIASDSQGQQGQRGGIKLLPNDLLFLNCLKVVGIFIIVYGHSGMQLKQLDAAVLDYDCQTKVVNSALFDTIFIVDLFFVVSSFLVAYITFATNRVASFTYKEWTYSVVHRYWRLAPIYILMVWFSQSVYMHTGSGPLWDYGSSNMTLRAICRRESLWYPLTLTANLHPLHQECIMTAWYVACDMQFYLLVPLLLVLLHKSARLGWLVTGGLIFGSIALRVHRYMTDPHAQHLELMRPRSDLYMRNNWDMHQTYLMPQYRIAAYLIGLLAGHYAYMVLSGKWKSAIFVHPAAWFAEGRGQSGKGKAQFKSALKSAASRRFVVAVFSVVLMSAMLQATLLIDTMLPVSWEPHVKYICSIVYGLSHVNAGLASALLLVALMFGQWEPLRHFMSHPVWTVLSRINYPLLMIQVEVINWVLQSSDTLVRFGTLTLLKTLFQVTVIVYPLAVLIAIVVEQPLAQLEHHFVAPVVKRWLASSDEAGKHDGAGPSLRPRDGTVAAKAAKGNRVATSRRL